LAALPRRWARSDPRAGSHGRAVGVEVLRVLQQHTGLAVDDLVRIPPTAVATIGRPFPHRLATVSPKPSAMLFWTTTSAARWSAFTITAFSSASVERETDQVTLRRASSSRLARVCFACSKHLGALGVVGDVVDRGPA